MRNTYTNNGGENGYVGLTSNTPFSEVVPVPFAALDGNTINVKRGAWMGGTTDTNASAKLLPAKSCMACCCGGMPPIIQEISGQDGGVAFLSAAGTIVTKTLAAGEGIVVDSDSVVGFGKDVGFDVKSVGNCQSVFFGGEGCFNTTLTGPGPVFLQSISVDSLMRKLVTIQKEKDPQEGGGGGAAPTAEGIAR